MPRSALKVGFLTPLREPKSFCAFRAKPAAGAKRRVKDDALEDQQCGIDRPAPGLDGRVRVDTRQRRGPPAYATFTMTLP
jgi:hypothetical protein